MEQKEVYYLHIIIMHTFIQLHTPTHSYCSNMEVGAVENHPKCTVYGSSIAHQRLSVFPGLLDRRSQLIFFSALDIFLSSKQACDQKLSVRDQMSVVNCSYDTPTLTGKQPYKLTIHD